MMKRNNGFTLLEVMLVILVIGVLAKIVVPSITWGGAEDKVADTSRRFKAVFDLASEYAMINNLELGVIIKDNNYRFVVYDGQRWSDFAQEKFFEATDHEEGLEMELELDGLPWAQNSLINQVSFQIEEDDDEDVELLSPQIFVLSSGDITPFRLTFSFKADFEDPIYFQVIGDFAAPVSIEGPLDKLP